jgi:hypothetical protein
MSFQRSQRSDGRAAVSALGARLAALSRVRLPAAGGLWPLVVAFLPLLGVLLLASVLLDPGRPTGDEGPLLAAAHRILEGRYAVLGTMDATRYLWHGPGLPALMAPLVALGVPLDGLRLISPLLMFAAALLFYRLLRLRLSRRAALIGAYALGLYAPAYYVIGTVDKDPLALLLAIAALDGTARYLRFGRPRHVAIAGLALAALTMTRLEYGWVMIALAGCGLVWWVLARVRHGGGSERARTARRWAVICAVGLLGCVPWLAYTYSVTGRPFYWGNSGGLSLYWMAAPGPSPLGEWHAPHTVVNDPALASYRPFFDYLATLRPMQRDLELQHVAVHQALAHPAHYGLDLLANLGRMLVGLPFPFTLPVAVIVGLILINGALLAGVLAAWRALARARLALPRETIPFLAFAAVAFAIHLPPTAEPRMLIPVIPVLIWFIAQAFARRRSAGREQAFA